MSIGQWRSLIPRRVLHFVLATTVCSIAMVTEAYADPYEDGKQIYREYCESCHGSDGRGAQPWVPDFYREGGLNQPDRNLSDIIQFGRSAMPAFMARLSPAQVDSVIYYLRMAF